MPGRSQPSEPFQRLIDAHAVAVLGLLRAMLRPEDAEDCFQETFMVALRRYGDEPITHPRAWLLTIARNRALDRLRADRRRGAEPLDSAPEPRAPDAQTPGLEPAADSAVWSAVAELPEKQRSAVALRFLGDLAYREVASAMGGTEAAARRNVADGLKTLRSRIDEEEIR